MGAAPGCDVTMNFGNDAPAPSGAQRLAAEMCYVGSAILGSRGLADEMIE
jgi:hypothetical protein